MTIGKPFVAYTKPPLPRGHNPKENHTHSHANYKTTKQHGTKRKGKVTPVSPEETAGEGAHQPLHPLRELVEVVPLVPHDAQQVSHATEVVLPITTGVFRQLGVETHVPRAPNDLIGPRLHHHQERRLDGVLFEREVSGK